MGHRPPYHAVTHLAFVTAYHWRTIRHRLLTHGITNPMTLPLHSLLDVTEQAIMEAADSEEKAAQIKARLYQPAVTVRKVAGRTVVEPPAGFTVEDTEASFDAFAAAGFT